MPEAAERRTSLPPPEGLEDDFVSLDHPVRELPGLLEDIERRARDRARPGSGQVDETEEAAGDRRLRMRRWAVLVLAAAAGGADGKIDLRSFSGMPSDPLSSWGGGPVVALLGGDLDGDQRDDVIAGLGSSRVEVFHASHEYLTVRTPEPPRHLAAVDGRLLVGAGNRVRAYQRAERSWPDRLRPMLSPILFTLALLLAGLPVIRLHPGRQDWRGVDWPRERLPPNWRRKPEGGAES